MQSVLRIWGEYSTIVLFVCCNSLGFKHCCVNARVMVCIQLCETNDNQPVIAIY